MSDFSNLRGNDLGSPDQVFFGLPGVYVEEGAHIAHFFEGEAERLNVMAPFIQAGLEADDQCGSANRRRQLSICGPRCPIPASRTYRI